MTGVSFLRAAAITAALLALPLAAVADAPFSFDTAFGRLPKNVRPIAYRIAIVPSLATRALTGRENIVLDVRSATATIQFNSLNETLSDVRFDGAPVTRTVTSDARQLTTITLQAPARRGRHVLAFAYRGRIETEPQGLFAQPYTKADGSAGVLLQTMFESTDARRAFPCWDEPAFRATFELTVTVPAALATISNMPIVHRTVNGNLAMTTFARTPPMPTYLVEYTAGDLARVGTTLGATGLGVWAVRGREREGRTALANAKQILADYDAYFGVAYPLPKLDSLAIPGGFQGGMENWGAIFYTDRALLLSPDSTMQDRQSTYSIQAHEMAHQWNGDLVTMGWWDDLWLNESFASWRSAKETDARNPTWRWWEGQDADKEKGMTADARPSSHAIHVHITDELQAETAFDGEITYSKGQAFLRMLEAYLTPDVFRSGIRRYIKARAYSNATGADLWLALGKASDQDVAGLASTWIMRPGFPLVTVNAKCDPGGTRMLNLTQKRFLRDGTDPLHTTWSIPLRVRSGTIGASTGVLFSAATQTISSGRCGEPLTIDAGNAGFFRVAYDDETFRANAASFGRLPDPDRIALLDDQWALASSGQAPLATYFTLARSMGDDLDTRAWEQIIAALDTIQYSERGTRGHAAFVAFARSIVRPVAVRLGPHAQPNEGPGTQMLRRDVLAELGAWGDPAIIAQARRRFAAFVRDRRTISPDDQPAILDIVAENADAATFEQLHSIARTAKSTSDVRRYYDVLMHVRNDALAQRAANIALSAEIPAQAASARYRLLDALAYEHPALAWRALTANIDAVLIAPNGESDGLETLAHYVPGKFWNSAPPQEIQTYIYGRIPPDLRPDLARGMDDVHFSLKQHALLDAATDAYLKQSISQ